MNFNDLSSLWRRQSAQASSEIDMVELLRSFEAKHRRMARRLFWRDVTEILAGLLVTGVFGVTGWKASAGSWITFVPIFLVLGVIITFLRERLRAHRLRLGTDATLLEKLEADIAELKHQHCLLSKVSLWYIAPIVVAGLAFSAIVLYYAPIPMSAKLMACGINVIVFGLCWWGVRALNLRAVHVSIEPRLRELEELHSSLVEGK